MPGAQTGPVAVVERSEMLTHNGNDLQVFLVRSLSHHEFFHNTVRTVGSELRLLLPQRQHTIATRFPQSVQIYIYRKQHIAGVVMSGFSTGTGDCVRVRCPQAALYFGM